MVLSVGCKVDGVIPAVKGTGSISVVSVPLKKFPYRFPPMRLSRPGPPQTDGVGHSLIPVLTDSESPKK